MKLVNCTPHKLDILLGDGTIRSIPASDTIARCEQRDEVVALFDGIWVTRVAFGKVVGLPEKRDGVGYIVSRIVAQALPERDDLFIPGPLIRDDAGDVKGCKGLSII